MRGYKAFYWDLSCRPAFSPPMMYEVGRIYELEGPLEMCKNGFHFCEKLSHVYNWYPPTFDTRICKVTALGRVDVEYDGRKCVTNRLSVVREVSPKDILAILNAEEPLELDYIKDRLLASVESFRFLPKRYILWGGVVLPSRAASEDDIPGLEKRADEWYHLLK